MRALTKEELSFVSGGFGFDDKPADPPVIVTAPRPKMKRGGDNWQICEGDCVGEFMRNVRGAFADFWTKANELVDQILPDFEDKKNGITLECNNGTNPTYVGHLNGPSGPIPIYECR